MYCSKNPYPGTGCLFDCLKIFFPPSSSTAMICGDMERSMSIIPSDSHIQIKHPFVFPYHFVEFQDDRLQSQTSHPPHRFSYLPSLLSHLRDCGYNPADRLFCLHPVLTPAVYYKYFLRPSEKAEFFLHILFFMCHTDIHKTNIFDPCNTFPVFCNLPCNSNPVTTLNCNISLP